MAWVYDQLWNKNIGVEVSHLEKPDNAVDDLHPGLLMVGGSVWMALWTKGVEIKAGQTATI